MWPGDLGLVRVYNLLRENVIAQTKVHLFQGELQHLINERASCDCSDWADTFFARVPFHAHPLK